MFLQRPPAVSHAWWCMLTQVKNYIGVKYVEVRVRFVSGYYNVGVIIINPFIRSQKIY